MRHWMLISTVFPYTTLFLSLSLGMGIMVTYGGYLSKQTGSRLPSTATRVVVLDTLFAILVVIIIFTTVFTLGGESDQGSGLVFVVMFIVLHHIAVGIFMTS